MKKKMRKKQFYISQELSDRFDRVNKELANNGSEIIRRLIAQYVFEKEKQIKRSDTDGSNDNI